METDSTTGLSRRSVLRLSFFSALGLTTLGLVPIVQTPGRKVLGAAFDLVLGVSTQQTQALDAAERYLQGLPKKQQWQIRGLIRAIEWGPVFTKGRRFTKLDSGNQTQWLSDLATSNSSLQRQLFVGLKQIGAMGFYQAYSSWEQLGYPGPLLER